MPTNLIETVARGAAGKLTGTVNSPDVAAAQDARGTSLVRNMAVGGMALGAGASAVVALLNYLKSLREENELADKSRLNDDTLYISSPHPQQKSASDVNRWIAPGLAVTGGILGAGGAYALTQAVYNYLQKKHKQKLLDEAQGEALLAADLEVSKRAAAAPAVDAKMNLYDLISATPVALPLLAALAAGGVTFATLRKAFPAVQTPKSRYPKRVRQVAADGHLSEPAVGEEEQLKSAATLWAEADCEAAAQEFLMLAVDQMAHEKSASVCVTSDLLHKAARDGIAGMVQTQRDGGMEALVEFARGASDEPLPLPERALAAVAICKSARLRPVVAALAAAEFADLVPSLYDEVLSHGEEQIEKFAGIATLLQLTYFRPQILEKTAADTRLAAELEQMMAADPAISDAMQEELTSDSAGGMSEDAEGGDMMQEQGERLQPNNPDPVDRFMARKQEQSPILEPAVASDAVASAPDKM
jgi:hypothetical protein